MSGADARLLKSAEEGDLKGVDEALKSGAQINARTEYNDTALNEAALWGHIEVVKRLLEESPDLENKGGAQLTPLMNAATRAHFDIVELLLEKGARVSDDLLSVIQTKINILEENAEGGMVQQEGVDAWKSFQDFLLTERYRQDVPELTQALSDGHPHQTLAIAGFAEASRRGVDIAPAVSRLSELLSRPAEEERANIAAALTPHFAKQGVWEKVRGFLENDATALRRAAVGSLTSSANRGHLDASLIPVLTRLLADGDSEIRGHAALVLASAAGQKLDVTSAIPELINRISDADDNVRRAVAICLYRFAIEGINISKATPGLETLLADRNQAIQYFANKALEAIRAPA